MESRRIFTGAYKPAGTSLHSSRRADWSPEDYAKQYFDDDLLALIVEKSNQTSIFRTGKSLNLTLTEVKVWLGINFIMSSLQYPKIRMYWEKRFRVNVIADAMSRDRFFTLRNSFKVVFDNEFSEEDRKRDRLWKIRPLIHRIWIGCMKQPREQELAVDEMMIPFHGPCGIKQFVPNKPNPEGLKSFCFSKS